MVLSKQIQNYCKVPDLSCEKLEQLYSVQVKLRFKPRQAINNYAGDAFSKAGGWLGILGSIRSTWCPTSPRPMLESLSPLQHSHMTNIRNNR